MNVIRARTIKYITLIISLPAFTTAGIFVSQKISKAESPPRLIINEIQISGETARDEFIELYNPELEDVSLSNWSIQYKSASGTAYSKKNFPEDSFIQSQNYFLIAYEGGFAGSSTPDMTHKTFSLASTGGNLYLVASTTTLTTTSTETIIDKVAWGTGDDPETEATPSPESDQSLERVDFQDTDNNAFDFIISLTPSPGTDAIYETTSSTPTSTQQENIILTELFPNPIDENDEFIELYNTGDEAIDLSNWKIADNSKSYTVMQTDFANTSTEILPEDYFLLPKQITKISLNNSGGETVTITSPQGNTTATSTYTGSAPEGSTWALSGETWEWTITVTPGRQNIITYPPEKSEESSSFQKPISTPSNSAAQQINQKDIQINEILPNPEGRDTEDEFIELKNTGNSTVDIEGWKVSDATGKSYTIALDDILFTILDPGDLLALFRIDTSIALNNSGEESVILSNQLGAKIDEVKYQGPADEDTSFAQNKNNEWEWTKIPTPEEENIIKPPEDKNKKTENITKSKTNASKPKDKENGDDESTNTSQTIQNTPFIQIYFSEILPNPEGSDADGEWIELFNPGDREIDLNGWILDDEENGSKPYTITNHTIFPQSFLVIPRTESNIALNNTSDTARLFDNQNRLVHAILYEGAKEGKTYAYIESQWQWSGVPTPDEPNELEKLRAPAEETPNTRTSKNEKKEKNLPPSLMSIALIRELPAGEAVKTTGIVTALPGNLGKTIFYIQSKDDTSGIQVYQYRGEFPDLEAGDTIEVTGTTSQNQGELRIKIKETDNIEILTNVNLPEPISLETGEVSDEYEGVFITISGTITDRKGSSLWIDDGSGETRIYIKKEANISLPKIQKNETQATVSGIVSETKTGFRILPRAQADLFIIPLLNKEGSGEVEDFINIPSVLGATLGREKIIIPPNKPPTKTILTYLSLIAIAIVLSILGILLKNKKLQSHYR